LILSPSHAIRVQSSNDVTRNYGNYPYGNYVGNAHVSKVINYLKHITTENVLFAALSIQLKLPAMTGYVLIAVPIVIVENF